MRVSEELNRIIVAAFKEAKARSHEYITPEHLLYASLFFSDGEGLLREVGCDVARLKSNLEDFFHKEYIPQTDEDPKHSFSFNNVLKNAAFQIAASEGDFVGTGDMLAALFYEKESFAVYFLRKEGVDRLSILKNISHSSLDEGHAGNEQKRAADTETKKKDFLGLYCRELVALASEGKLDPVIGRESEIFRTMQVLSRRNKNNPVHVGSSGVGKTAVTEGLAIAIAKGECPDHLKNSRIFSLDLGSLLAGTKYRGDFEARMKKVLGEIEKIDKAIIFIDEIHNIVGAGAVSGGAMDASNILKPLLVKGGVRCIGATTDDEYRKFFNKDRGLSRRFQKIEIKEPDKEQAEKILAGIRARYEDFHHVIYSDKALKAAVELSDKYINERFLPDKAIDVIDEAGAFWRMKGSGRKNRITRKQIEEVVAEMARIPAKSVSGSEVTKLKNIEKLLRKVVFGQDEAIHEVAESVKRARAGFGNPDKPVASFLFVGPTGVGKTELVRQLGAVLSLKVNRFDMSEYQEKHSVARLIGAPPGYVGYESGGQLVEAVRKSPHSILLLDEIEKAHFDIFNTLLQVMDYATLTDNSGLKADFRNVIIIMTSNAGARELSKGAIGFNSGLMEKSSLISAVSKICSPEFRNRLDKTIVFNALEMKSVKQIVLKEISLFREQLKDKKVELKVSDRAVSWLAEKGFSQLFGAREIARVVQDYVKKPFVDLVLFKDLKKGGTASVTIKGSKINIEVQK